MSVVVGHDLLPTMEAMAKQVRKAKKGAGRLSAQLKATSAARSVYCVLENDSLIDDAGVPEMEEELSTLPNRVQESNHWFKFRRLT